MLTTMPTQVPSTALVEKKPMFLVSRGFWIKKIISLLAVKINGTTILAMYTKS